MGKTQYNCGYCGRFVWKYESTTKAFDNVYCSQKCFRLDRRNRVVVECIVCGNEHEVCESHLKYESSNYCSDKCKRSNGYYGSHYKKYPNTSWLRNAVRQRKKIETLDDVYVKGLIDLPNDNIPQELIELKRLNIKRKRKLKEKRTHGNSH